MADPANACLPPLGKSYLISSVDRTGGNQDWMVWTRTDARGRIPLMDAQGPGCVSRIWIASFKAKRWFFYFDDETAPRVALTNEELFGGSFPFVPPLAGKSGGGKYSLVPIPFAKRLRIEVEPEAVNPADRNYFQINYTRFDRDTAETFPDRFSPAESNAVREASSPLIAAPADMAKLAKGLMANASVHTIPAGEGVPLLEQNGKGTVEALALDLESPGPLTPDFQNALRTLRLKMSWDGGRHISVNVPLGDFFCNPFYKREFTSFFLGNVGGTYISRLPMPFRKGVRIELANTGKRPVTIRSGVQVGPPTRAANARVLQACWSASTTSGAPFVMATAEGRGHYLGCLLSAIGQDGSWNILEGDEYIIPNGDRQQGQYGTGLEDYFNGAYYYTSLFDLPFHGLIEKGAMRTDQYRFHSLDAIPFEKGLEVGIEFGDGNRAQGYMSSIVYWYADKPVNVAISPDQERLLARPQDRFALAGMMAQLFTLERAGLWADAAARCRFYAHANRTQPWSSLLDLRAEACKEMIDGAAPDYAPFLKSNFRGTATQAGDLAWRLADPARALLGVHMRGTGKVWIDGKLVAEASGPDAFQVRRLQLPEGAHTWEVDFTPTQQGSFFTLCLRTATGNITSAGTWDALAITPLPGRRPPTKIKGGQALPNMSVWQFQPNAFPGMQSPAAGVSGWAFWDSRPLYKQARMRQHWTNGVPTAAAPTEIERSEAEERAHAID